MSTRLNKKRNPYEYCALFLFFYATIIIPLFFKNKYFDMLQAKAQVYMLGSIVGLFLIIISVIINIKRKEDIRIVDRIRFTDACLIAFGTTALISSLLSNDRLDSLTGLNGWGCGGFEIIAFVLFYLIMSRHLKYDNNIWLPVIIVLGIIYLFGILNSMGIDTLMLHEGVRHDQYYWYISTIGNANWYVGFLSMTVPLFAVFYMDSVDRTSVMIFFMVAVLGIFNMVLCACDGIYLCIFFCFFPAIPYLLEQFVRLRRLGLLISAFAASLLLVKHCPAFYHKSTTYSGISDYFIQHDFIGIILLVLGLIVFFAFGKESWQISLRNKKLIIILFESIFASVIIGLFIYSVLNYNDDWGTERGLIWSYSLELFNKFGLKDKLIGVGPETLRLYYKELANHFHMGIASSHSTLVQNLLTTGIIGFTSWLLMWVSLCLSFIKHKVWKGPAIAFAIALVSYFGQSIVYSNTATNMAWLCVVISQYLLKKEENSDV